MAILIESEDWKMPAARLRARSADEITRAVAHTEAGASLTAHDKCDDRLRAIDRYHRDDRDYAAIGYHRAICPHGSVYECRPLLTVGAHCQPANRNGIGYVFLGQPAKLTDAAAAAFVRIVREDERRLGRSLKITTHARVEPGTTACPGDKITGLVSDIAAGRYSLPEERTHTVTKGDTLWSLAERYYRNGARWPVIADANKIDGSDSLAVGQRLVIP